MERLLGPLKPVTVCQIGHLPELDMETSTTLSGSLEKLVRLEAAEALEKLKRMPIQDLVVVGETLESMDRRDGDQLLAGLRDLYARRILLRLAPNPGEWNHQRVMAFGFQRLFTLPEPPRTAFYGFDLGNYKVTPDWLNPKHWANPEMFDRYRW
nr:DUF6231 family protein [Methylonatrum kenyense]